MKADFLLEPELQFFSSRHIDARFGLANYSPFDRDNTRAPKAIKLAVIGTPQTVEESCRWLDRCRTEIQPRPSKRPRLFVGFPGFSEESRFNAKLLIDRSLCGELREVDLKRVTAAKNKNEVIESAVAMFHQEIERIIEKSQPSVILCAPPSFLLERLLTDEVRLGPRFDFHDMLKAKAMPNRHPVQLVWPATYNDQYRVPRKMRPEKFRKPQDEATRAWNLHVALYYKAGGIPWRLPIDQTLPTTLFMGLSFYKSLDGEALLTSTAQVFNERGEGVILRGGAVSISREDRQPHLTETAAHDLLKRAMEEYRREHQTQPARVVLHKSSSFSSDERSGFHSALQERDIELAEMISIKSDNQLKLFRNGYYPPLRGTWLSLDDRDSILYTHGSVDFYNEYPGMYVPRSLYFRCEVSTGTQRNSAYEILALSKMNWNDTSFGHSAPVTLEAARSVGAILKYIPSGEDRLERSYRFYM